MSDDASKPFVRLALASELPAITHVLTRAFARDPAMNWYGSVKDLVPDHKSTLPSAAKTMKRLSYFMFCLCKATLTAGGIITVVVVPGEGKGSHATGSRIENIVAVVLWLPPGRELNDPVQIIVRTRPFKLFLGWGLQGLKVGLILCSDMLHFLYKIVQRIFFEFMPKIERTLEQSFKSRGIKVMDSWHLLIVAVDPDHEGKGANHCHSFISDETLASLQSRLLLNADERMVHAN
jgi:hypothetical protein